MMDSSLLTSAMTPGARLRTRLADVMIERHRIGFLWAPSGRLVACDPYCCDRHPAAFGKPIPPGRYPVELSIAHITSSEYSVAMAILQLREVQATRWDLA